MSGGLKEGMREVLDGDVVAYLILSLALPVAEAINRLAVRVSTVTCFLTGPAWTVIQQEPKSQRQSSSMVIGGVCLIIVECCRFPLAYWWIGKKENWTGEYEWEYEGNSKWSGSDFSILER